MRILIADDQRTFGTALADMVRWCGHEVVAVVGSGLEAIYGYTLHQPDLVLMDHRMPKLSGATACRHILAKDPTARIILISAWSPLNGADASGAMSFLPKPVDMERLKVALQNVEKTIAPPIPEVPSANFNPPAATPDFDAPSVIPIPQEIISPIETFPIETFPLETAAVATDIVVTRTPIPAPTIPLAKGKKSRRSQRAKRNSHTRGK
jgi:two-component system, chemotaxis family, chemotaxis protein CheY